MSEQFSRLPIGASRFAAVGRQAAVGPVRSGPGAGEPIGADDCDLVQRALDILAGETEAWLGRPAVADAGRRR